MPRRKQNQFRIIAGTWRSRRCSFPDASGLRPTPDRVRETLFNWLGERIVGARCLDLFAGSGALGLEALSRGASQVTFVEREHAVAEAIRASIAQLGAEGAEVVVADARGYLATRRGSFDAVFLDPPFQSALLAAVLPDLIGELSDGARLYMEFPVAGEQPALPPGWSILKSSRAGQVAFALAGQDDCRYHKRES